MGGIIMGGGGGSQPLKPEGIRWRVETAGGLIDQTRLSDHMALKLGHALWGLLPSPPLRPDVLPPPVMNELAKLQDRIEPFSTAQARAMVEADLGAPIDTLFSEFSEEPIAAASLAQVRGGGARGG